ncbi:hypothetical protein Q5Y75_24110 [Ruegeria sp. 2205SS24-7]|uniref:hypothetical protein n=1 Tax=Ruegeria discodermiae TaxID=3064389 RepID=UPI0027424C90|nr:hypothetical protein [Ruegeria sp. 2205SS24-7]MDP5220280.1 hypothetical protein [Ruegeria sp. 2205SS24-7]
MLISKKLVRAAITFEECARVTSAISSAEPSKFDAYETMELSARGEAIQHAASDLYGASDYMLTTLPLGIRSDWSTEFINSFDHLRDAVAAEYQLTSFWTEWLDSLASGEPLPVELLTRVALIDNVVWDVGPRAVAQEIARIRTEMALTELPRALISTVTNRHGVGGNNPPKEIEDVQVLGSSITLIWDAAAGIEEEVASDAPDRDRVAACLQALKTGLAAIVKWCGRKVDLTVDTLIKWGIPSGGAYLVTQPEKVEALIRAAEGWLKFLL